VNKFEQHIEGRLFLVSAGFLNGRLQKSDRFFNLVRRQQMQSSCQNGRFKNRMTRSIEAIERASFSPMNDRGNHPRASIRGVDMVHREFEPAAAILKHETFD
jgi:hypothetical protein